MDNASASRPTAFICAMPMELEPVVQKLALSPTTVGGVEIHTGTYAGREAVAIVTGMGTVFAKEKTEALLDVMDVERVLVVGITGALENETPIGTLVMPEIVLNSETGAEFRHHPLGGHETHGTMYTTNKINTDPDLLARLLTEGVISLDMETAAIAEVCEARGIPWSVFRVISDRASDGSVTEEIFKLSNQDGTPNEAAITKYFQDHPDRIEAMAKLAEGSTLGANRAADAAIEAFAAAAT